MPHTHEQNQPLQIIAIDNERNQFQLKEDLFKTVLSKVPANMKVAIVSVVGAFRTGKSFLLDFFLRYLRLPQDEAGSVQWEQMFEAGEKLEGNINQSLKQATNGNPIPEGDYGNTAGGFSWRAGRDTNTTGIWIWSEPFVRKISTGETVAVLLVDTQGMFDQSLSQLLTTSIFGLSTLLSSYQVYNVKNQIQEDQLQHLSLFAEYGRVALQQDGHVAKGNDGSSAGTKPPPPFQTLQFLVRDWNEFEDLEEDDLKNMKELEKGMTEYLDGVLSTTATSSKDLVSVRTHIKDCFETVDAFLLPHPGFEVVKKSYDGDFGKIRPTFKKLMRHYVHALFEERLAPKCIHGAYVTGDELLQYVKAYTHVFCEAKAFPECTTLLNAVAGANNRNAYDRSKKSYEKEMKKYCGAGKEYRDPSEIEAHGKITIDAALTQFDHKATYGPKEDILQYRDTLQEECHLLLEEMLKLNEERDPIAAIPQGYMMLVAVSNVVVTVIVAVAVAVAVAVLLLLTKIDISLTLFFLFFSFSFQFGAAYFLRVVNDWIFCWSQPTTVEFDFEYADICTRWSSMLTWTYSIIFMFIGLAIFKTGNAGVARVRQLLSTVTAVASVASSSAGIQMTQRSSTRKKKDD